MRVENETKIKQLPEATRAFYTAECIRRAWKKSESLEYPRLFSGSVCLTYFETFHPGHQGEK